MNVSRSSQCNNKSSKTKLTSTSLLPGIQGHTPTENNVRFLRSPCLFRCGRKIFALPVRLLDNVELKHEGNELLFVPKLYSFDDRKHRVACH